MDSLFIFIDEKKIEAKKGENLLYVALRNGIYIPHLCFLEDREVPYGACRLCYIELEGKDEPVLACSVKVEEGMKVKTDGEDTRRLQRMAFELLLSAHKVECAKCGKRMVCELQKIAKTLKVTLRAKRLKKIEYDRIDDSHPDFIFDQGKCVLCGKCVWFCEEKKKYGLIGFVGRGIERRVSTFLDRPFGEVCLECTECVDICPVGAFSYKEKEGRLYYGYNR